MPRPEHWSICTYVLRLELLRTNLRNSAAIPDFHLTSHYDSTGAGTADLIADCNVYRKWDDLTRRTTSCIATTRALVDSRTQTHFGEKKTARTEWPDSGRQLSPGLPDAPLLTGPLSILRLSRGHPAVASGRLRTRRRSLGQPRGRLRRAAAAPPRRRRGGRAGATAVHQASVL